MQRTDVPSASLSPRPGYVFKGWYINSRLWALLLPTLCLLTNTVLCPSGRHSVQPLADSGSSPSQLAGALAERSYQAR